MASVEYDLDTTGGLMPQVQALIAPPTSDEPLKTKKNDKGSEHPYFKRPGKGHNHDSCDACNEGGDLICCDKCPASFHLTCHDPPLEESDIPAGQWLCHTCRTIAQESKTNEPQQRNKRSNSNSSTSSVGTKPKKTKLNSLEILVKAASMLNPKQFELPRYMNIPCVFPGTDKVENPCSIRNRRNTKVRNKMNELQFGGIVSLPTSKCHECGKSCRIAPLLACDYCPLLFHLDCLDPPLTALPAGRWMCPNHVEQFIDSKLVTSVSATERIRLWDRFTGPLDQDAIKTEFFRKVHCKNPPFRIKVKLGKRKRIKVPPMVLHHYKNPVPLLPSLRDVLRLESLLTRTSNDFIDMKNYSYINEDIEKINGQISNSITINGQIREQDNLKNETINEDVTINGLTRIKTEDDIVNGTCNGNNKDLVKLPDVVSSINADIDRELKQLDDRLIKLLAYQRIQHLLSQNDTNNQSLATLITNSVQNSKPFRHMPLPSELLTPADIDRISRVFTSPKKSKITRLRSKNQLRARAMLCPVVSKHFYNIRTSEVDPANVRHDASFMGFRPTVSARFPEAIAMRYRCMTIGRGSTNDIELERFGHCNFTSPKHAVIFYDECTKHYELINYSDYGTQVNNVLYSCDFSEKPTVSKKEDKSPQHITNVRDIIDKKRKVQRSTKTNLEARMCAQDISTDRSECQCGSSPTGGTGNELQAGWEGTAVLNHGSLIRFGCITFVFSIVDCASV